MKESELNGYFEKRATQLGFDAEKHFAYYSANPDEPIGGKIKQPLLWPDKRGNICIGVLGLDGQLLTYDASPAKSKIDTQPVHWKRFVEPKGEQRYGPCKSGIGVFPWLSPKTCSAFEDNKKIKRLVITEGYFKAMKAYIDDIGHVIGIPSITIWKPKGDHRIFQQISKIVEQCKVEEVLWLTDGDTLTVKYEPRKDLYRRPNSFYTAVRIFRELFRDMDVTLYYGHILKDQPKGLDDLLIALPKERAQIKKELFSIPPNRKYTTIFDVTSKSHHALRQYFGIHAEAADFYNMYAEYIGLEEFVYRQGLYKYNDEANEIEYLRQGESARFERIGKTFFIQGTKPTKSGSLENVLVPITVDEIKHMYKYKSNAEQQRIIRDIEYYNGAINRPAHHDYEQFITTQDEDGNTLKWFNLYRKLTHKPMEGDCSHSMMVIKHKFGDDDIEIDEKVYKSYELGLDYVKLLWEQPQQMLPILCLVSKDRQTGKTTFWNWMRVIFQQNARFVRVENLTGQFTSFFASSLLTVVDETLIEKRTTMERLKALVTAETFTLEAKHQNAEEVDNFVKVGISSNNINNFAQIDQDEIRFWVREVGKIEAGTQNYDLLEQLEKEVPAFLHLLEQREFVTKKTSRAWFDHKLIRTAALDRVVKKSRSGKEQIIEDALTDHMKTVEQPIIDLTALDIKELIGQYELTGNDIRWVVQDLWEIEKGKSPRIYHLYSQTIGPDGEFVIREEKHRRVFYTFLASKFFANDELFASFSLDKLIKLEVAMMEQGQDSFFKDSKLEDVLGVKAFAKLYKENPELRDDIATAHKALDTLKDFEGFTDELWSKSMGLG